MVEPSLNMDIMWGPWDTQPRACTGEINLHFMIYPDCSNEEDMQLLFLLQPGGLVQHSTVPGCAVFAMKVVEGEPRITFARLSDSVPAGLG